MVKWRDEVTSSIGRFRFKIHPYGSPDYDFDQVDHADLECCDLVVTPQGVAIWPKANGDLELFRSELGHCLLYTSPSPRDGLLSRMPSSA